MKSSLKDVAVDNILKQKTELSSLFCMHQPRKWFKLQDHVNDRVGDAGLGKRRPNTMGQLYSHCPYYLSSGVVAKLSEHHVLLEC